MAKNHHGGNCDVEDISTEPMALTDLKTQQRPPTLQQMFTMYLRAQTALNAAEELETPEEADDFEEDWDADTLDLSAYQIYMLDHDESPPGVNPETSPDVMTALQKAEQDKEVLTVPETTETPSGASGTPPAKESSATKE